MGVFAFFADGVLAEVLRSCTGVLLTFTPIVALSYPPLRRNSMVLDTFSEPTFIPMSQELASVKVDDLRREDGRRGAETGEPKVELEFEDAVDLRMCDCRAVLSVDELGVEGESECSGARRK